MNITARFLISANIRQTENPIFSAPGAGKMERERVGKDG